MDETITLPTEPVTVADIQFRPGQKVYYFDPAGLTLKAGDHVIIDTARGAEYGICAAGNHAIAPKDVVAPLRQVIRIATAQDEAITAENRAKETKAYQICLQKIEKHGLDMQLVSAEMAFDGSKLLFYFTADDRVDFRELVKDLASTFHTRIELRQIGVRDKAKMVGGLGICGRPFCCASFLDDFQPVSIKMAKTQNLSLNPTKISGTCGRLMCCLKYEQDTYESLIRSSPKPESFVDTAEGRGTVIEADILRQRVKVRMEDEPNTVSVFPNEEIAVLRSGKAKKNDPPIPEDLAPLSGNGKRVHRAEKTEDTPVLEAIRFRYSTESVAEEKSVSEEAPEEAPKPNRRNRRRPERGGEQPEAPQAGENPQFKRRPPKQGKPAEGDTPRQERKPRRPLPAQNPEAPANPGENAEGKPAENRKPRRSGYRRYRKPQNNKGNSGE